MCSSSSCQNTLNKIKENVKQTNIQQPQNWSHVSVPLDHKMNISAPWTYMNLHCSCVLIYTSAVILHILFLLFHTFFFSLKGKRETHTQLHLSYFTVALKLWLRLTNDLPVGISLFAQNWPLKNIVIIHGGDFIGISLFIPVGCQASFCMSHLSKNQWEAFEYHFFLKIYRNTKVS